MKDQPTYIHNYTHMYPAIISSHGGSELVTVKVVPLSGYYGITFGSLPCKILLVSTDSCESVLILIAYP